MRRDGSPALGFPSTVTVSDSTVSTQHYDSYMYMYMLYSTIQYIHAWQMGSFKLMHTEVTTYTYTHILTNITNEKMAVGVRIGVYSGT